MTNPEKIANKNKLKEVCQALIEQRIAAGRVIIHDSQQSANEEGKSSAGDKYETSRAMNHLEKDMHTRQLAENMKELATLHSIDVNRIYTSGKAGAFLQCSGVSFFIAAGLGKQMIGDECIFFVSPHAPLAKLLQSKKAGDFFVFNVGQTQILEIY